ncbi:MAG TPA: hypothetical protein VMF64_05440 [Steroidobacteraceae bacterium]|nr:hypothetical protein [Steroidobacteraceae bacterium]
MAPRWIWILARRIALVLLVSVATQSASYAQGRDGRGPPPTAQAGAPIDLTGYWVSLVTQDWIFRMVTPRRDDYSNVPLNEAGIRVMNAWDPARDVAAGEQCKSYGAPAIMRVPEHLHITWQDSQTMKVQTDAGRQTRLFHFVGSDADRGARSLQGYSVAIWQVQRTRADTGGGRAARPTGPPVWGDLKVMTGNLAAGYLRKNGIPYSDNTKLMEYYDLLPQVGGEQLLMVTSSVTDPTYLTKVFIVNSNFKKMSGATGWQPSPCSAIW